MGVRFVIGRAGSGKSLHCFREIVELMRADPLGEPIYLIVPKQETFTAERELTCTPQLNGFCRTRIVSFDVLGEEILAECGGTAIPQINELGRQMVIGHLLRQHEKQLTYYASAARQVGLAAELDATFAELERCGRSAEDLSSVITDLESTPGGADVAALAAKLRDLRLLYQQYSSYLGQDRLDPNRRLEHVLASLQHCTRVQRATIFVDGFLEFTDHERRMLAGLAQVCRDMQITLLADPRSRVIANVHENPDELSLFHRTETTFKRLWFAFSQAGITAQISRLEPVTRFGNSSLAQIEKHLFDSRPLVCEAATELKLIEAPDRRAEVDAAARHVRSLIDDGFRFREIAVLMRSLEEYHELIDASFREHGIPYFVDRRRSAVHHPLLQFTRSLLQIALHDWPHDAVMTLLKTELAGLSRQQVDELENYVIEHRIHGHGWADDKGWSYCRKLTRREDEPQASGHRDLKSIESNRRLFVGRITPLVKLLSTSATLELRKIVLAMFEVFERFRIRDTLRRWMSDAHDADRLEEEGEHQQVWSELIELLDQMVDILGDERVTAADFVDILETGLERFDLALTPPTVDQVLIGEAERTRGPRPRAVILLGMNDTQFPRVPREGSILSDSERHTLQNHRVELEPDSQRALLDEQLLGYIAFTRASQWLCLTRCIADDQARPQAPSIFWVRLRQQFPNLVPVQIPRESRQRIDCIGTPRQLVTALMSWVRHGEFDQTDSVWPALYHWLATHECCNDAIDVMRYRAWRALSYTNEAKLDRATASELFHSPLRASVSQIETFASCPFKHFLSYGLRLTRREDERVTSIDLGNVCHGILENIVRQMLESKAGWEDQPPELVRSIAQQVGQELRGELMLSTARNQYILAHIEKTIQQVIAAQAAATKRGKLAPWRAELPFGDDTKLGALIVRTPEGNELRLQGKIDRVDFLRDQSAFAVIDYKYRGSKLALDRVYHGLSLQLLTYLLVLERNGSELAKRKLTPVAAFYVKLLRDLEKIEHPDDATSPDDPAFHLRIKPRGLIDAGQRHLLDSEHVSKQSDVVNLYLKEDGTLGYRDRNDGCETAEFAAMLQLVERKLGQIADRILQGDVSVAPYRIGQSSPCAHCEYRGVCRFDVAVNSYRALEPMKREDVLARALGEAADGQ